MSYSATDRSLYGPRKRAMDSSSCTTLVPVTISPLPYAYHSAQDSSPLPFTANSALQYVYPYHPGYLALPSTYTTQEFGTVHSRDNQYAPTFERNCAQPIDPHAFAAWTPSFMLPSERDLNADWYRPVLGPTTCEDTTHSASQYVAAYNMCPAPAEFADVVDAMVLPGTSRVSHTYHEPQHSFPYDASNVFALNQPLVTGTPGTSQLPTSDDCAPSHRGLKNSTPLICDICGKGPFGRIYELRRHKVTVHAPPTQRFLCEFCQSPFKRDDDRKRHVRTQHEGK